MPFLIAAALLDRELLIFLSATSEMLRREDCWVLLIGVILRSPPRRITLPRLSIWRYDCFTESLTSCDDHLVKVGPIADCFKYDRGKVEVCFTWSFRGAGDWFCNCSFVRCVGRLTVGISYAWKFSGFILKEVGTLKNALAAADAHVWSLPRLKPNRHNTKDKLHYYNHPILFIFVTFLCIFFCVYPRFFI